LTIFKAAYETVKPALYYLRNKEKQEIDFLTVRDGLPWLPAEVKLSDATPSKNWSKFLPLIGREYALHAVNKPHWKVHRYDDVKILVADVTEVFPYFV
jgi:hypothetical protein